MKTASNMNIFFLIIISITSLLAGNFYEDNHPDAKLCNIQDTSYTFLRDLIKKYVDPKYQDFACLEFFIYKNNSMCNVTNTKSCCNVTNIFLPLDTEPCRSVREKIGTDYFEPLFKNYTQRIELRTGFMITASQLANTLYNADVDSLEICKEIKEFNRIPYSQRTTQMYANIYNSSGKYAVYGIGDHFIILCSNFSKNFQLCIRDANAAALKFFGNLPPPIWTQQKCAGLMQHVRELAERIKELHEKGKEKARQQMLMPGAIGVPIQPSGAYRSWKG